jgi:hypothetical protein
MVGIKHGTTGAAGTTLTATLWNEAHTNQGVARATMSGDQSIVTATPTKVQFDTETHDPDSVYDITNYRYDSNVAGYYLVSAAIMYSNLNDTDYFYIKIYKTGAEYSAHYMHTGGANDNTSHITDMVYLGATDYLEIYSGHTKGSNATIEADHSFFTIVPVRI